MNGNDSLQVALQDLQRRADAARTRAERLEAELTTARNELDHAQGAIDHIKGLIDPPGSVVELPRTRNGLHDVQLSNIVEAITTLGQDGVKGMDAIETVLKNSPRPLTLEELTKAVNALGWFPDAEDQERAVRAAGNRLRQKNENVQYAGKYWLWLPHHGEATRLGEAGGLFKGE